MRGAHCSSWSDWARLRSEHPRAGRGRLTLTCTRVRSEGDARDLLCGVFLMAEVRHARPPALARPGPPVNAHHRAHPHRAAPRTASASASTSMTTRSRCSAPVLCNTRRRNAAKRRHAGCPYGCGVLAPRRLAISLRPHGRQGCAGAAVGRASSPLARPAAEDSSAAVVRKAVTPSTPVHAGTSAERNAALRVLATAGANLSFNEVASWISAQPALSAVRACVRRWPAPPHGRAQLLELASTESLSRGYADKAALVAGGCNADPLREPSSPAAQTATAPAGPRRAAACARCGGVRAREPAACAAW
jgi:hypothetical protein